MSKDDMRITRRELMKRAALAAGTLPLVGSLVSACSQPSPSASSGQAATGTKPTAASSGQASTGTSPTAAPAVAKPATGSKKSLVFVEGTDISVLDPMMVVDTPSNGPCFMIYDGLVTFDKDMNVKPVLATTWDISDDKKTWTFHLRPNVKFSNGAPFNSKSVQFTFERMMDPATASPARTQYAIIDHVETPDDLTAKFVTKEPFPDLLLNLAQPNFLAYDPDATKKFSVKDYGRNPVGTGPYMLKDWVSGDHALFVPNPNYWGPAPALSSITYKPVPEAATRAAMLRTGEADIAVKIAPEDIKNLQGDSNLNVLTLDSMYQISFELNNTLKNPPLDNKMVRQALNYAVDKDSIVKNVLMGLGAPMVSPMGPGIKYRATFKPYEYDPAKAKKMLADAGYPNGFKLVLTTPHGRYLKDQEVAQAVQGYLQAVGIQAEVQTMEWAPYMVFIQKDASRQAMLLGRATPVADYTATRLWSKAAIGLYNVTGFWRPKIEELLPEARSSFDDKQRTDLYQQIQAIVWDEAPWIFLHNQKAVIGVRKGVDGFVMLTTEVNILNNVSKA